MDKWLQKRSADISSLRTHPSLSGVSDTALKILVGRNYVTPDSIEKFLFGGIKDLHDPRLMKDAEKAVAIIEQAIQNGDLIVVYGDYDCDGVTSTATMVELLRAAGAKVVFFTNNRFVHGYGICPTGVDDMLTLFPDTKLIVTVDNGISAHAGVAHAKAKGLTVVVTDHHDPAATLPDADALVDPKRADCQYPFKGLCGAGVAFKLMMLMYYNMGLPLERVYQTMDVVALGTVADIVPLVDENRIIVTKGLAMMREEKRDVFRLLRKVTEVKEINAHYTLGFIYGPMINAIGRLDGDPKRAIDMFFEERDEVIEETIHYLVEVNERRKTMTVEQTEIAEGLLDEKGLRYVNVIYHPDFHEGIVGLIAGRIKEKYNRPVFVFTKEHGFLKGSGRGISGFHLKKSMDKMNHLLKGYGGHEKAAGLSLEEEHLLAFEEEMNKLAEAQLTEEDFQRVVTVELALDPKDFDLDIVDGLKELEPFGEQFPKPIVGVRNFHVDKTYTMGSEKQHIKLRCGNLDLIMWSMAEKYQEMGSPTLIKALGYPELNVWKERVTVQFIVDHENIRPAS